jgi:hypothetical protein
MMMTYSADGSLEDHQTSLLWTLNEMVKVMVVVPA